MVGMSPRGAGGGREKCHVSCPEPTFFAALVRHETLAGDDEVSFVARVMPLAAYGPGLPDRHLREEVTGPQQHFAPRLGITAQEPGGRDFPRFEVEGSCRDSHDRIRHTSRRMGVNYSFRLKRRKKWDRSANN